MMEKTQIDLTAPKRSDGYMLIEALIAIAIFSIGFLAVATLVLTATRNNANGNILTQANMLARQTLEQLKNTPDITTLPSVVTINTESDIDANGNPGGIYTRTTKIEDLLGFNTSRAIEVAVSWAWRGRNRRIVMSTVTKGKGI
jgi:type IV pilus assembly protein PilV